MVNAVTRTVPASAILTLFCVSLNLLCLFISLCLYTRHRRDAPISANTATYPQNQSETMTELRNSSPRSHDYQQIRAFLKSLSQRDEIHPSLHHAVMPSLLTSEPVSRLSERTLIVRFFDSVVVKES